MTDTRFKNIMVWSAFVITTCAVIFCTVGVRTLLSMSKSENESRNCDPKFYDYIIDKKPEEIHVYREDGREFVIKYGRLDEFLTKDSIR